VGASLDVAVDDLAMEGGRAQAQVAWGFGDAKESRKWAHRAVLQLVESEGGWRVEGGWSFIQKVVASR